MKSIWYLVACTIISTNIHSMKRDDEAQVQALAAVTSQNNRSILSRVLSLFHTVDQTNNQQKKSPIQPSKKLMNPKKINYKYSEKNLNKDRSEFLRIKTK